VLVDRIEEGLWRWTTAHPDWKPTDDWEQDVGCVYFEAPDAIVLIDPLVPADAAERERFLEALDRDVERVARPVVALLTCMWHRRSADELAARYDGRVVAPFAHEALPDGVRAVEARAADEVVFWLEQVHTVVSGDALLGSADGVTLCPVSWLGSRGSLAQLRAELAPLLELPVERVLTSHGPPQLSDGHPTLAHALGAA
jgi:glyoxylase-like metal-dependent hydrolase (beta-lactamase superfamily II)